MKRKTGLWTAAAGLILTLAAAGIFMYFEWRSYQEKMEILYVALEQEKAGEAPLDTVTELLKGRPGIDTKAAEEKLKSYGYGKEFPNHYKKSLIHSYEWTLGVCGLLYLSFLLLLLGEHKRKRRRRSEELLELQSLITEMREKSADGFLGENIGENGDTEDVSPDNVESRKNFFVNENKEMDEELESLLMNLDSLSDSLALLRRQSKLEKEETKTLVTDISHQLKTPVAALKTSFEILQSGGLKEEERQEFLERCSIQILRLEELVGALVNISRMETGMIEIKREEKNIFDTILLAVSRIYPKAEEKQIEIALEAEDELQQMKLPLDGKWLCEAFLSVLENAVKYSKEGSKITIRMIKMTVFLRIEIEDEGIGIPKSEWNRIFRRFYRGKAKEVQETAGSGVGLYLAREIVTRHQGTLTAASPHNAAGNKSGSRFVFQLPY